MRQLIDLSRENTIQCDNPTCDFVVPYSEKEEKESAKYINMPCPKCGENLLTEKDYLMDKKFFEKVAFLNKWFSWLTIFGGKKKKTYVHIHNGVKISDEKI